MPLDALVLALAAALLHASWNLLLAGSRDVLASTAVALISSVVVAAPVAALTWDVGAEAAPFIAASAALETVYFFLLAAAYSRSELSLVYPLARGGAPVVVLLGALALGRLPTAGEAAGVSLVAIGVVLVRGLRGGDARGVAYGLVIAAFIAGYTLVDNAGIEHASPIAYLELVLIPVCVAAYAATGSTRLRAAFTPGAVAAGCAGFAAYALVLAALDRSAAAPVAAVRETSVVIAVVLAAPLLRERVGPARIVGAVLVAGGVALLSLA